MKEQIFSKDLEELARLNDQLTNERDMIRTQVEEVKRKLATMTSEVQLYKGLIGK